MTRRDWESPGASVVGLFLNGRELGSRTPEGEPVVDDSFVLLLNAAPEPVPFAPPPRRFGDGGSWRFGRPTPVRRRRRSRRAGRSRWRHARSSSSGRCRRAVPFATAELAPLVAVGGLAHAAAGLVRELASQGVEVEAVLPDYGGVELAGEERLELDVPAWASPAVARRGRHDAIGALALVDVPGMRRPHPYLDEHGEGWPDNDARFLGFSVAVTALARVLRPDLLHLNDWHTAAAVAGLGDVPPSVLTVHNLAYQGRTGPEWVERLGSRAAAFAHDGGLNPLAGGIALAAAVVVVPHLSG